MKTHQIAAAALASIISASPVWPTYALDETTSAGRTKTAVAADVMVENITTYATNCGKAYFRTKSGTFKTLALLSGGLGECQFLTLNNTMPGTVADKKIMDRYIEIDNLPTRSEQDKEIEKESVFGLRDAVTNIFMAELAKHCTYLGGKNETSEVSCK